MRGYSGPATGGGIRGGDSSLIPASFEEHSGLYYNPLISSSMYYSPWADYGFGAPSRYSFDGLPPMGFFGDEPVVKSAEPDAVVLPCGDQEYREKIAAWSEDIYNAIMRGESADLRRLMSENLRLVNHIKFRDKKMLYYAIESNRAVLQELLEQGADPNEVDFLGYKSLHYAMYKGLPWQIELLYEYGAFMTEDDMMQALDEGLDVSVIIDLMVKRNDEAGLMRCVSEEAVLKMALESIIKHGRCNLLAVVLSHSSFEMVFDPLEDKASSKLLLGFLRRHYPGCENLYNQLFRYTGDYLLYEAIKRSDIGLIDAINAFALSDLKRPYNGVSCARFNGQTVLHCAVRYSDPDVLAHLLDVIGKPDLLNRDAVTPLHYCALYNRVQHARVLFAHGCDAIAVINDVNVSKKLGIPRNVFAGARYSISAIDIAISRGNSEFLEALFSHIEGSEIDPERLDAFDLHFKCADREFREIVRVQAAIHEIQRWSGRLLSYP